MTVQVSVDLTSGNAVDMSATLLDTYIFSEVLDDGRMRRIWADGIYWEGTEEGRPLTGEGAMHFQSGPTVTGRFKDGVLQGSGMTQWPDGSYYHGEMKDNKRHGYGTYEWADGTKYEGEYKDDLRNGQGHCQASDYEYWGSWKDDMMEGEGIYECLDEQKNVFRIFEGRFEKHVPVSGTLYTNDGEVHEVCYDGKTQVTDHPWLWKSKTEDVDLLKQLPNESEEYRMVSSLFHTSIRGSGPKIVRISRIENPGLRQLFEIQRNRIRNEVLKRGMEWNPSTMERWAFHGTGSGSGSGENPGSAIMNEGFLVTLAGSRNGMAFGAGAYFARDARLDCLLLGGKDGGRYSLRYCHSDPSNPHEQSMLLARRLDRKEPLKIVVGRYTEGQSSYRAPPLDPSGSAGQHFHSMVDNSSNPGIFVISHSASAYPAYKIDFATGKGSGKDVRSSRVRVSQQRFSPLKSLIAAERLSALRSASDSDDFNLEEEPTRKSLVRRPLSGRKRAREDQLTSHINVIDLTGD
ncbi:hypothetical protein GUITHDRAFT_140954 [Guillardia theta CCMP2712]|uniref:Poly [ADP-ribose] polymerase n=1 Tax=Guillardia theta (strain CCMP2712) TaxID=905079 RepID=L1J2Q9_GUITC|nr:hypothetical protein GUITHDRAFT_140954 [Guillardia theta CCMP2712]EKX42803.1 hypothetical protein GUITHDRAFT_140954 [Guillardia theta CCMP2712]|eukprot:XP_005829783.1 hypothetical protein GUITHDRAFT_140954 [Guillardia theta CCMP2712]